MWDFESKIFPSRILINDFSMWVFDQRMAECHAFDLNQKYTFVTYNTIYYYYYTLSCLYFATHNHTFIEELY